MEYDSDLGDSIFYDWQSPVKDCTSYGWIMDDYNDTGWLVLSPHPVFCRATGSKFLTHKLKMRKLAHELIDGDSVRLVRRVLNLHFED